jgi:hypothetical protein
VYYNLIEMAIGAEINGKLVHQPGGRMMPLDQTDRIETRPRPRPEAVDSQRMESPVKVVTGS